MQSRNRHRIPVLFSLSMVDVLCCALGCVILLWLVNSREAKQRNKQAGETKQELDKTALRLDSASGDLDRTKQELDEAARKYQDTAADLDKANATTVKIKSDLAALLEKNKALLARLESQDKGNKDLSQQLFVSARQVGELEKLLKGKNLVVAKDKTHIQELQGKLLTAEDVIRLLNGKLEVSDKQAKDLTGNLKVSDKQAKDLTGKLELSDKQAKDLVAKLELSDKQAKDLVAKLELSDKQAKDLVAKLELSDTQAKDLTAKLSLSDKTTRAMTSKLSATDLEIAKLLGQVKDNGQLMKKLEELVAQLKQESKDQAAKLTQAQKDSQGSSAELAKKALELEKSKIKLEDLIKEMNDLTTLKKSVELQLALSKLDMSKVKTDLSGLQKEKLELLQQALILKEEMANRFAGIELTGKKVIFLVDISGSMGMLDAHQPDPKKWPTVCEIIGKLMRSLPDATHYQVITFSDKVGYPLGDAYKRKWLLYEGKSSADFVVSQMQKIKPYGGTHMYPAFEEAFAYKFGGLDTIYLISDGLPDPPETDIPANIKKLTLTQQSAYFCTQVRQTLKNTWNAPVNSKPPVRINAIGFFFDSPEVGAFLWALTRENDGNFVGMSKP